MHNTHMSRYIPCTAIHYVTGTWSNAAGDVAGTIVKRKTAGAETGVVTVPIVMPSNSVDLQGCKLKSIELDYEIETAACTSVTAVLHKITRGADTAVAMASHPAITQDLAAGVAAATHNPHKLTVTLTTPEWIDHEVYFLCEFSFEAAAGSVVDILGAVANFTMRL
jgi:hypothetical protein